VVSKARALQKCGAFLLLYTYKNFYSLIKNNTHEKERIKQLFQEGIKNNQDNDDGQQKDCKTYVYDEVIKVCS
jgi:hypothetical protein